MGDYLRNLVRRTGAAPPIRPRARSLFEPGNGGPGMRAAGNPAHEIEQHVTVEAERPIVPQAPRGAEPAVETRAVPSTVSHAVSRTEPRVATGQEESRKPIQSVSSPKEQPAGKKHPTERSAQPVRVAEAESLLPVRTARPAFAEAAPGSPFTLASNAGASTEATTPAQASRDTAARIKPAAIRPAPTRARELRVEQHLTEHAPRPAGTGSLTAPQSSPLPAAAVKTPTSGPEIHIAIGRVIVHAAQETATRPAPAARPQTLQVPLDQYLRQRGGRA